MSEAQNKVADKFRSLGWRTTGQGAWHESSNDYAIVFSQNGCIAVLYPDGTYDRNTAQRSTVFKFRDGWIDLVAVQRQRERQQRAMNALVALTKYLTDFNTRSST